MCAEIHACKFSALLPEALTPGTRVAVSRGAPDFAPTMHREAMKDSSALQTLALWLALSRAPGEHFTSDA